MQDAGQFARPSIPADFSRMREVWAPAGAARSGACRLSFDALAQEFGVHNFLPIAKPAR
jgi:hypothetical protein